jgi:predicted transcriptional regulator
MLSKKEKSSVKRYVKELIKKGLLQKSKKPRPTRSGSISLLIPRGSTRT